MEKEIIQGDRGIELILSEEDIEKAKDALHRFNRLMAYFKCAMMEIETKFNVLNEEFSLRFDRNPINSIKTRIKSPAAMREKLERKGFPVSILSMEENLADVAGVRVICSFESDVYALANALLSQNDIVLIEKKDYIRSPKQSGYRSLHLIVSVPIFLEKEKKMMKVEIQLRTIAMDFFASLEHDLRYKVDKDIPETFIRETLSPSLKKKPLV